MRDQLRHGAPQDAAAIAALTHAAYRGWAELLGRPPLPMQVDYAEALTRHRFDLLFIDDRLTALVETTMRPMDLLIVNLAVDPGAQGRGHGRRLLALAEDLAVRAGRREVRLYTNARFGPALHLYASHGYRVEREEDVDAGVRVHMVKALDRPA